MIERADAGPTSTIYHIHGDLEEVVARMREHLDRYHPLGYMTRVLYLGQSSDPAHKWECQVRRLNSCE